MIINGTDDLKTQLLFMPPEPNCVLALMGRPFDGGTILDNSPYGNHGAITGASWAKTPGGFNVLYFDGSDEYITCTHNASLDMGTDDFTLLNWVKCPSLSQNAVIVSKFDNTYGYYYYINSANGNLTFSLDDDTNVTIVQLITDLEDDVWHCVGASVDRDGDILVFQDMLVASGSCNTKLTINTVNNLIVGGWSPDVTANELEGYIGLSLIIKSVAWSNSQFINFYNQTHHLFGV